MQPVPKGTAPGGKSSSPCERSRLLTQNYQIWYDMKPSQRFEGRSRPYVRDQYLGFALTLTERITSVLLVCVSESSISVLMNTQQACNRVTGSEKAK